MTLELSQETIVTRLLSSNEIIKPVKDESFKEDFMSNLGEYLKNPPKEDLPPTVKMDNIQYSFIREGYWNNNN